METKNMSTLNLRKSIGRSPLRLALLLIPLAFACFWLSPSPKAENDSDQLPGDTTFEGDNALRTLRINIGRKNAGVENTAIGFRSLEKDFEGDRNTAIGARTLDANVQGSSTTAAGDQALTSNTSGKSNTAI